MRVSRHICFRLSTNPALAVCVLNHDIPFEPVDDSDFIVLDIFEDDLHWSAVKAALEADGVHAIATTIFTQQKLKEAEWLTVRSKWHNGYPQPESAFSYREITYDAARLCKECGAGLVQKDCFRLAKAPKWGTRHFFSLNWVYDELFVDDTARNILEGSGLTGFHFLPVKNRRGTEVFPGVHQLFTEVETKPDVVTGGRDMDKVYTCAVCSRTKYQPTGIGMHALRRATLEAMPDICRTHEVWGSGHGADRLILISQRMYRLMTDNHLERSLVFEPIQLID